MIKDDEGNVRCHSLFTMVMVRSAMEEVMKMERNMNMNMDGIGMVAIDGMG